MTGCTVGQRPGNGTTLHLREPTTGAGYWLYLPQGYHSENAAPGHKRHPLVMTFHGMKPFDNANPQIREWQQEADRYGFVVCAPELLSPDLLREFPIRHVHPAVAHDESVIIGVLDDLVRTTDIDPSAVLSTSWSSGGYIAHYVANRHPERFSCIAVRQSNFSADILDPNLVPRYRDDKVGIFYAENDFAICQKESQLAAVWYARHGFDVTFAKFSNLGHERTPGIAAAFFARTCGAVARTPPVEIARLNVREVPTLDRVDHMDELRTVVAALPRAPSDTSPAAKAPASRSPRSLDGRAVAPRRDVSRKPAAPQGLATDQSGDAAPARGGFQLGRRVATRKPAAAPRPIKTRILAEQPRGQPTPQRPRVLHRPNDGSLVTIRLSSTIGIAPLLVSYSAVLPKWMQDDAYLLWTDNGEPISNSVHGQKYLAAPGDHKIALLVTASDGREYRTSEVVTVLERIRRSRKSLE